MKSEPIVGARIEFGDQPFAPEFGDRYHPSIGALAQARHVFLRGNQLPARWAGRERFVIAETGFGLGNNFIAAWDAWRSDPQRCRRVEYVAIERHPPTRADLERAHHDSPLPALAGALIAAWPPLVFGLHLLDFEGGALRLLLAFGDVAAWLPELRFEADAIFLDGFAPAANPAMWEPRVLAALGRRAAPGATAATWSVARPVQRGLEAAGFRVERAPGIGGKREITVAQYAPRFTPASAADTRITRLASGAREAVVVGAGLAGACCARALADEGWSVRIFERRSQPAAETSGNAGGIFHGTVHGEDGLHARLLRAAALLASSTLRPLVESGRVTGQLQGLLRLGGRELAAMRALIASQRLVPDWVQALDAGAASALAGVRLDQPAWFYPGGGWIAPADFVLQRLDQAGIEFCGEVDVQALEAGTTGWRLLDRDGRYLAETPVVILANAADAQRLAAGQGYAADWQRIRGQVSGWRGETALRLPLAGEGYALPLAGRGLLCGSTQSPGDEVPLLRAADEALNLARLERLCGLAPPPGSEPAHGRVGWRLVSADRLPVAGPLPVTDHAGRRDQCRHWPRIEGLYLCSALGGRGVSLAPLLGRLLAAQIAGAPWPLEQGLVDAVDPARGLVRQARHAVAIQP